MLAFFGLLVALLAIPVTLNFRIAWPGEGDNEAEIVWGFGLLRCRVPVNATAAVDRAGTETASDFSGLSGLQVGDLRSLSRSGALRRIRRFVADLWRALDKRDVELSARVGLGDPADTGRLWAVLGPMAGLLASCKGVSASLAPDFLERVFAVHGAGSIRVIPLQIIYLFAALLLSPSIWQGMLQMRRAAA